MKMSDCISVIPCGEPTSVAEACSPGSSEGKVAILKSSSGVISSPNHPRNYNNLQTCRYAIDVTGVCAAIEYALQPL